MMGRIMKKETHMSLVLRVRLAAQYNKTVIFTLRFTGFFPCFGHMGQSHTFLQTIWHSADDVVGSSVMLATFAFSCFPWYPFQLGHPGSPGQLHVFLFHCKANLNPRPGSVTWTRGCASWVAVKHAIHCPNTVPSSYNNVYLIQCIQIQVHGLFNLVYTIVGIWRKRDCSSQDSSLCLTHLCWKFWVRLVTATQFRCAVWIVLVFVFLLSNTSVACCVRDSLMKSF